MIRGLDELLIGVFEFFVISLNNKVRLVLNWFYEFYYIYDNIVLINGDL